MHHGEKKRVNALVVPSVLCVYRLPGGSETLVETDLFPYLEAFFAPEGSTFDQAVDASVRKAVGVPGVVEPETCSSEGSGNYKNNEANVCSKCTSASRSNSSAITRGIGAKKAA